MDATKRVVYCVCLWLFMGQVRGLHIPPRMNRTIQNLTQHYKISARERFNGQPVFNKSLSGKSEVDKVYMGGILKTYEKLLNKMLEQLPTPSPETSVSPRSVDAANAANTGSSVREQLNYILKRVHYLKHSQYKDQEKLLNKLDTLHDMKTDNLVIQSKALWELPWLYEEASSLVNNDKKRRRRQTRRDQKRGKAARD